MSDPATFPWAEFIKSVTPLGMLFAAVIGARIALRIHNDKKLHENQRDMIATAREMKLASVVVSHKLALFIRGCDEVAHDEGLDEYGHPSGPHSEQNGPSRAARTNTPTWNPGEIDVEWKYLNADMTDRIFELSMLVDSANYTIAGASFDDDPPDYPGFFNSRRVCYAHLGLYAHSLREQLLRDAGIEIDADRLPEGLALHGMRTDRLQSVIDDITFLEAKINADLIKSVESVLGVQVHATQLSGNAAAGAGAQAPLA